MPTPKPRAGTRNKHYFETTVIDGVYVVSVWETERRKGEHAFEWRITHALSRDDAIIRAFRLCGSGYEPPPE